MSKKVCTQTPKGWYCLIPGPHPTCAAWPTWWTRLKFRFTGTRIYQSPRIRPSSDACSHPRCSGIQPSEYKAPPPVAKDGYPQVVFDGTASKIYARAVQPAVKIPSTVVPTRKW